MANPQPPKGMPSAPFSSSHSRVNSERTLSDSGGAPPASTTMTRVAAEGAPNPQFNEPEPSKPPLADSRRQRRKNRKPSGYLKIQHEGLSVNHIPSALSAGDLEKFKSDFHIPPEIELFLPGLNDSAHHSDDGKIAIYEDFLHSGLRFPLPDLLISLLKHFRLGLGQLNPNSIRMIVGFLFLCKACDITPSVNLFRRFFTLRRQRTGLVLLRQTSHRSYAYLRHPFVQPWLEAEIFFCSFRPDPQPTLLAPAGIGCRLR